MKIQYICSGILQFGCNPDCVHAEPHDLCHYSDHVDCRDTVECQNINDIIGCETVFVEED